jgi:hypothetical protein
MRRFNDALKAAKAAAPKPKSIKGDEAGKRILSASLAEGKPRIQEQDPAKLQKGDEVEVWPTDTGVRHHDRGKLVGLNEEEIVLLVQAKMGQQNIHLHFPRTNFRIVRAKQSESKL